MRVNWPDLLFFTGAFLAIVAVGRTAPRFLEALTSVSEPPYFIVGGATLLCLAGVMMHAGRWRRPRWPLTPMVMIGWAMLSLTLISAAAIVAHSWVEPRIYIALIFSGAFLLVGVVFIAGDASHGRKKAPRSPKTERARAEEAAERLTGDLDWRDGYVEEIAAAEPGSHSAQWPAGLGIGLLFLVALLVGEARLIFAVVALGAGLAGWLLWARRRTQTRLSRFGTSRFTAPALPLSLAEGIEGRLEIPHPPAVEEIGLRLRCIRRWVEEEKRARRAAKQGVRQTRIEAVFDETASAPLRDGVAAVAFRPPKDLPPARRGGAEEVVWELTASAPAPGVSYRAVFRLPVEQ